MRRRTLAAALWVALVPAVPALAQPPESSPRAPALSGARPQAEHSQPASRNPEPWTATAASAPARDGEPLSLAAAVHAVLARHPALAAIDAAVAGARLKPAAERSVMPPMVDAGAWQWPVDRVNPRYAQWMVTMSQDIPGKGKRDARAARMEADAAVMANDAEAKRREIAADVARTYVDLRVARDDLDVLDASRALVRRSIDAAEARYAAGRTSQADVLAGIVELTKLGTEQTMARERERMARSRLNVLLGRDADAPIGALDRAPEDAPAPRLADVEQALRSAHPEATAIDRAKDVARAEVKLARLEARPDVLVQGGYMAMPYMPDALQASVGLTWPNAPWAKRRIEAAVKAAEAGEAAVEARRAGVEQELRLMAQELIVKADGASERAAQLTSSVLPQVEHALEVGLIAYQADRGEFMPLVEAQRTVVDARREVLNARADRDRALGGLRALLGELTTGGGDR